MPKLYTAIDAMRLAFNATSSVGSKDGLAHDKRKVIQSCEEFATALDGCSGTTLQERWTAFESTVWKRWTAGEDRPCRPDHWAWGPRVTVMTRLVVPSWGWIKDVYLMNWIVTLPETDSLFRQHERLVRALGKVSWASEHSRHKAARSALRLILASGYQDLRKSQMPTLSDSRPMREGPTS